MFEEFSGLPLHPLVVHAPVVLVPLLAAIGLLYAFVPKLRRQLGWAAVALAVVAPLSAVLARLSGDGFKDRLYGTQELDPQLSIVTHQGYGDLTMWSSIGLGVVTLALAAVRRGTETGSGLWRVVSWALAVLLLVAAVAAIYFVIRAGHTGSEMTHGGRLPN